MKPHAMLGHNEASKCSMLKADSIGNPGRRSGEGRNNDRIAA